MLKKIKEFMTSYGFMSAIGITFMLVSLGQDGVEGGVTFLTGVIICYLENIIVELKRINGSK